MLVKYSTAEPAESNAGYRQATLDNVKLKRPTLITGPLRWLFPPLVGWISFFAGLLLLLRLLRLFAGTQTL
jgi:hypothetical protein